jgi:hypothetical protein
VRLVRYLDSLLDFLRSIDHARRRAAQLNEVLALLLSIEHGVESSHFVDAHGCGAYNLSYLIHGGNGEEAACLSLGQVQEGDDARLRDIGMGEERKGKVNN